MKRRIVAGNWKMHLGPEGARDFVRAYESPDPEPDADVLLFPPAVSIVAVARELERTPRAPAIGLGVQNIHHEDSGAFTGETSAPMAREAGAAYALVGHSERRHVFGESPDDTRRKTEAALRHGLVPVLCVGETLEERRAGRLEEVLRTQVETVLGSPEVRKALASGTSFVLAYEPVWAIGTGETASPSDAAEAHRMLRDRLEREVDREVAASLPILYGGSVKPGNASELMASPGVDGVLVGGASLEPDSFARIVAAAR